MYPYSLQALEGVGGQRHAPAALPLVSRTGSILFDPYQSFSRIFIIRMVISLYELDAFK
jgi:hypothetical protein